MSTQTTTWGAEPRDALWFGEVIGSKPGEDVNHVYAYSAETDEPDIADLIPDGWDVDESRVEPTPANSQWWPSMLQRAAEATGDQRDDLIDRIERQLHDGNLLPANNVELMCLTCGYVTDSGNVEDRDAEHMRFDGAHYPGWIDETPTDLILVRDDVDLMHAMLRNA